VSQPVRLSDTLVTDARETAALAERSIAGQIEFWAHLGQALEPVLRGDQALALRSGGRTSSLAESLASVDTAEGRARLDAVLASRPFPHYEAAPGHPGFVVRIAEDGSRTLGRFVGREFQPADPPLQDKHTGT
jgi:hypothetical protein